MGRKISYNRHQVLQLMAQAFVQLGYEATSLDNLVQVTGLLRGSLYSAFGSKHGMFVAALRQCLQDNPTQELTVDMVLIGLLELAPKDQTVSQLISNWYRQFKPSDNVAAILRQRLLKRAQIE